MQYTALPHALGTSRRLPHNIIAVIGLTPASDIEVDLVDAGLHQSEMVMESTWH